MLLKAQIRTSVCSDDHKLQALREENAAFRRFLKEHVLPEIVADPMGRRGIMVEHDHVLRLDTGFYEGKEPWPLTSWGSSPTPATSTDYLIQQLRAVSDQYKNGSQKE